MKSCIPLDIGPFEASDWLMLSWIHVRKSPRIPLPKSTRCNTAIGTSSRRTAASWITSRPTPTTSGSRSWNRWNMGWNWMEHVHHVHFSGFYDILCILHQLQKINWWLLTVNTCGIDKCIHVHPRPSMKASEMNLHFWSSSRNSLQTMCK